MTKPSSRKYLRDAPFDAGLIGFMAAAWALPPMIALGGVCIAVLGARLRTKPMLVGAFMGAASVGAVMVVNELERESRRVQIETAPDIAPSLKP